MMETEALKQFVLNLLDDMKAQEIVLLDVRDKTDITDYMILASGTSDRHVKAMAEALAFQAKEQGEPPLGCEGLQEGEWALVDLNTVVVHLMLPKVRAFYNLEGLWSTPASAAASA